MRRSIHWRSGVAFAAVLWFSEAAIGGPSVEPGIEHPGPPPPADSQPTLEEIGREARSPVSDLWQLNIGVDFTSVGGGGFDESRMIYSGVLAPFIPVHLSEIGLGRFPWSRDFRLISGLSLPLVLSAPLESSVDDAARTTGFGDIQFATGIAPGRTAGWLWGIGATFIFPSASDDELGQGRWQAGPTLVMGFLNDDWQISALVKQWWSVGASNGNDDISQLSVQYALIRNLPREWQIGMQPTLAVDWLSGSGNQVAFPVGLGVGKTLLVGRLPVQLWFEADYYVVQPDDDAGPRWGINFTVTPIFLSQL